MVLSVEGEAFMAIWVYSQRVARRGCITAAERKWAFFGLN